MANDAVSVCLCAVAEAIEWTHALESDFEKRPMQRRIVHPPSLRHLSEVLPSGESGCDPVTEHSFAYDRIFAAYSLYSSPQHFSVQIIRN
jgi:hypothetical protein